MSLGDFQPGLSAASAGQLTEALNLQNVIQQLQAKQLEQNYEFTNNVGILSGKLAEESLKKQAEEARTEAYQNFASAGVQGAGALAQGVAGYKQTTAVKNAAEELDAVQAYEDAAVEATKNPGSLEAHLQDQSFTNEQIEQFKNEQQLLTQRKLTDSTGLETVDGRKTLSQRDKELLKTLEPEKRAEFLKRVRNEKLAAKEAHTQEQQTSNTQLQFISGISGTLSSAVQPAFQIQVANIREKRAGVESASAIIHQVLEAMRQAHQNITSIIAATQNEIANILNVSGSISQANRA